MMVPSGWNVAFRVDASLAIGSGHVVRCLTLADALARAGATCHFVSQDLQGNLLQLQARRGHRVYPVNIQERLVSGERREAGGFSGASQSATSNWKTDSELTSEHLAGLEIDWLVVDCYALERQWELALEPYRRRTLVVDDLADRHHTCNLLLDQNVGRRTNDYAALLPEGCVSLIGPEFALLRPEFAELRAVSLKRRDSADVGTILVCMGGVDFGDTTGPILECLADGGLPSGCRALVVMGSQSPSFAHICEVVRSKSGSFELLSDVADMARIMATSDLAIGATGMSALERCALGLPSLVVILADNQRLGALAMSEYGAVRLIGGPEDIARQLKTGIQTLCDAATRRTMSERASSLVDGHGTGRVIEQMVNCA